MSGIDELIREAQFVFANIGPGSANRRKNTARARRLAKRVIRQSPQSIEAAQARIILTNLEVNPPREPRTLHPPHSAHPQHVSQQSHHGAKDTANAINNDDWRSLQRMFFDLPSLTRKILIAAVAVFVIIPGSWFVLIGLALMYAIRPRVLRQHVHVLLTALN